MQFVLSENIMHLELRIWTKGKDKPIDYYGACLGTIINAHALLKKGIGEQWGIKYYTYRDIVRLDMPVKRTKKVTPEIAAAYLAALKEWEFGDFPLEDWWTVREEDGVNAEQWFAAMAFCRLMWEYDDVVFFWYKWTQKFPKLNKYKLLALAHRAKGGHHSGHSAMLPAPSKLPDPVKVNRRLKANVTGFDFGPLSGKRTLLDNFSCYSDQDALAICTPVTEENLEQEYAKIGDA